MDQTTDAADDGFTFHGSWQEYLPIAVANLLLTLVTLGFYRFWATARERRYLWSRTQFLDERLEWTGTGKEMFIGFLVAMVFFLPLILFLQFGVNALILRGMAGIAGIGALLVYSALLILIGVALFRALRYRLSRTNWRGIRGGSDGSGWAYARSYTWRTIAGIFTLGLLAPWAMVTLWRRRWSEMSFGSIPFGVGDGAATKGLIGKYLLIYLVVILGLVVIVGFGASLGLGDRRGAPPSPDMVAAILPAIFAFYFAIALASLAYFAAFYSKVVGEMRLDGLSFAFDARPRDWLKLVLGHIGLAIVTLGFGLLFVGYRNWSFFVRHIAISGALDPAALAQSTTMLATDAEGLADAFDIGAI